MAKKSNKVVDNSELITTENISKKLNVDNIIRHNKTKGALKRRKVVSILLIFVLIALLLTGSVYGVLQFIEQNSMRIIINQSEVVGLALANTSDFANPVTRLSMNNGLTTMSNITYTNLNFNQDILGQNGVYLEGGPRGANYVAYTFFVKNVSANNDVKFRESIRVTRHKNNADAAIRIMIIEDRTDATIYAKAGPDSVPEYAFYNSDKRDTQEMIPKDLWRFPETINVESEVTTPFIEPSELDPLYYVRKIEDRPLARGEFITYTIVVWFEGSDAECIDNINNGYIAIEYEFEITEVGDTIYD